LQTTAVWQYYRRNEPPKWDGNFGAASYHEESNSRIGAKLSAFFAALLSQYNR